VLIGDDFAGLIMPVRIADDAIITWHLVEDCTDTPPPQTITW
jgi:hypothetical protein